MVAGGKSSVPVTAAKNLPNNQMNIYGSFPAVHMRRMRRNDFSRRLMRESLLSADDLLYPVFIVDGKNLNSGAGIKNPRKRGTRPGAENAPAWRRGNPLREEKRETIRIV